jgi:ureidoglycolate lyase
MIPALRRLLVEPATAEALAPFGTLISAAPQRPLFAAWPGTEVFGPFDVVLEGPAEILQARLGAASFPARVALLERHPRHTQVYLGANGRPFVMVLAPANTGPFPDLEALRAFLVPGGAGVVLTRGVWHEFPLALEHDTLVNILLTEESHHETPGAGRLPLDAAGPDLERWDMNGRCGILVDLAAFEPDAAS